MVLKMNAILSPFIIQPPYMSISQRDERVLKGNIMPSPSPSASSIVFHSRVKFIWMHCFEFWPCGRACMFPLFIIFYYLAVFVQIWDPAKEHEDTPGRFMIWLLPDSPATSHTSLFSLSLTVLLPHWSSLSTSRHQAIPASEPSGTWHSCCFSSLRSHIKW